MENKEEKTLEQSVIPKCGIVMPISTIDECSSEHWGDVLTILKDVIINAKFEPSLVSDADDIGIIQKRIIQNLYSSDIVVCDVSCKNPNVMFELGVRLAFDKPTIIIKDDLTDYTFDTSIIEHLVYPRDLRFNKIILFKENLVKKIQGTYNKSKKDPNYTTFLKNFGEYKIAQLTEKEISSEKFIMTTLDEIRKEIILIKRGQEYASESIDKQRIVGTREKIKILSGLIEQFKSNYNIKINNDLMTKKYFNSLFDFVMTNEKVQYVFNDQEELLSLLKRVIELPF